MIRRPPRSTLFPLHDALPISLGGRPGCVWGEAAQLGGRGPGLPGIRAGSSLSRARNARNYAHFGRSEEHTSELQSQSNLVCRLLLEKKKKNKKFNSLKYKYVY